MGDLPMVLTLPLSDERGQEKTLLAIKAGRNDLVCQHSATIADLLLRF